MPTAPSQPSLPPVGDRLTWSEVSEITGLALWVIKRRIAQGVFPPPVRVDGHQPRFSKAAVERAMREMAGKANQR